MDNPEFYSNIWVKEWAKLIRDYHQCMRYLKEEKMKQFELELCAAMQRFTSMKKEMEIVEKHLASCYRLFNEEKKKELKDEDSLRIDYGTTT